MLVFAALVFVIAAFLYLPALALGQTAGTSVNSVSPESGVAGAQLTLNVQGSIETFDGPFIIYLNDQNVTQGNADGYSVNTDFTVYSISPGNYNITLEDTTTGTQSSPIEYKITAEGISAIPISTLLIMGVAVVISFGNMGLNRLLITRMIGWHEYRSMQKEMQEYNSQRMAAMRAKDEKTLEKLKKKERQIQSMQTKMFKPQLLLLPMTAIYFVIWPILTGFFPLAVAVLPGLGAIPFFYWYLICSFFFGTVASRLIGVTPIQ
jgi:uncharacterized membrane protein (DUF106 family)